jgi:hypothetical protein
LCTNILSNILYAVATHGYLTSMFLNYAKLVTIVNLPFGVIFSRRSDDSVAFKGVLKGKLYLVDFSNDKVELDTCLIYKTIISWL